MAFDLSPLWVVLLVLSGVALVVFGVVATVANYEVHGPCLGYLFSWQLWQVIGDALVVIARVVVAARGGSSSSE